MKNMDFPNNTIKLPQIEKQNGFTAIRIICSLIVLYEHFMILTNSTLLCFNIRGIAVNVFFILSGFWVTRSFFTSDSLTVFFKKRIKKIFPLYITIVFSFAFLLVFFSSLSPFLYFTNSDFWKYLFWNFFTLNFIQPNLPGVFNGEPVNGSLWTIKIEIGFYVILPLIVFLCSNGKNKNKRYRYFCVLITMYLLSILYGILIPIMINKYKLPSSLTNQLPAYLSYFATGMFFFYFYDDLMPLWNKLIIPSFIILIISAIIKNNYFSLIFTPITLGIVIMWCALKAKPLFIFSRIYDFSYCLYLIHYPIIMIIKDLLC